jgi:hypothetical protein
VSVVRVDVTILDTLLSIEGHLGTLPEAAERKTAVWPGLPMT